MTTMAGGALAAPVTAGVLGGGGAAKLLNESVFSGNSEGAQAARVGTYVGAVAGTAASVGALATVGAGSVGLATIGGVVGGGMAAGATMVLAEPAVAGAVGAAFYCLFKR